jgi:hypothetical protein
MWEPRRLTSLWASTACYRDSFNKFGDVWRAISWSASVKPLKTCRNIALNTIGVFHSVHKSSAPINIWRVELEIARRNARRSVFMQSVRYWCPILTKTETYGRKWDSPISDFMIIRSDVLDLLHGDRHVKVKEGGGIYATRRLESA